MLPPLNTRTCELLLLACSFLKDAPVCIFNKLTILVNAQPSGKSNSTSSVIFLTVLSIFS